MKMKWLGCDHLSKNLWLDTISGLKFPDELYRNETSLHSFSAKPENYLKSEFGLNYLKRIRENVSFLNNIPFGASNEFIIQDYHKNFDKYKEKSIFILGGGPSINEIDLDKVKTDVVWASNNFFKNSNFKNIQIDGLALTPYIDVKKGSELRNYADNNSQIKIFFETERGDHDEDWQSMYDFISNHRENFFLYNTRYRSKLGITPRQICLAIFLGFKDIYIAGFDGLSKAQNYHGFEGTKNNAHWYDKWGGERIEIVQFVQFWNYIYRLKKSYNFNIINLSENSKYNISSEITKWLKLHN